MRAPAAGAGRTHVGYVRRGNEDAYWLDADAGLAAVADGLGGHPAGDVASRVAIETLARTLAAQVPQLSEDAVPGALADSLRRAHAAVGEAARADARRTGMGTTAVVAYRRGGRAWIGNVGDSRAYLLAAAGQLHQLTVDDARDGFLTQALGLDVTLRPAVTSVEVGRASRLLLCTDGLTNMLDDEEIAELLAVEDVSGAADALVAAALAAGGVDNVTVVVLETAV